MKKIVVLTGAGVSAESGIATFRDSGGLWEKYRIEDVATPEGFAKDPQLVLDFYNKRRRESLNAMPNKAHLGLADMQTDYEVFIITQNVDNLHERAGSVNVLHLHGELMKVRSTNDPDLIYEVDDRNIDINLGDLADDGSQLRPHIVWFGEPVPLIEEAERITSTADVLVVIGTSLNVYPAANLINCVRVGTPIYVIDPNNISLHKSNIHFIKKVASEGVADLSEILGRK